uniref:NADH-ubiquinone oxidoreductase chain 4L n=1 Tax=Trigoniophthalmus alternatus TaxID=50637 RepID=B2BSA8_9INSE|nr:NADH dehydrogenase subunit 4L [Trigoniophthalmus alternatus]ABS57561.1 NADH dehydrogenase subunit 4L [Trigoniophthalmus alternatus]
MNFLVNFLILLGIGLVFSGIMVFVSVRKHLLAVLFSLEYIVLGIFILLGFFLVIFEVEVYFMLYFLTLAVCEGALGLSILVSLVRMCGNDYFLSFNTLRC